MSNGVLLYIMKLKDYLKNCNEVYSTTFDPKNQGVCRLHLVPPEDPKPTTPWVVIINGYSVIPLQSAWAVLLKEFITTLNSSNVKILDNENIRYLISTTVKNAKEVFTTAEESDLKDDLKDMIRTFRDLAVGKEPSTKIGYMTLKKYSKYMSAPHRVDLMVSAMEKNGKWNCNQKCLHCYASGEKVSSYPELSTSEWKKIIDKLKKARVPAITFTGGEATVRSDLVELVEYSKWFVTRLNTNGILLTEKLAKQLYDASLDSVQITLYSSDKEIHNKLVGADKFDDTVNGIKNAIKAGLDVSINTPLCSLNKDYLSTVKFAESLGVRYFSCSGLIPTGNAVKEDSTITRLSKDEITEVLKKAYDYTYCYNLEISFTSPGWIDEAVLKKLRLVVPSCGACLSNMAIAPNGEVIPCQSWLYGTSLGNLLNDEWTQIWKNKTCKDIRKTAINKEQTCLLKEYRK